MYREPASTDRTENSWYEFFLNRFEVILIKINVIELTRIDGFLRIPMNMLT